MSRSAFFLLRLDVAGSLNLGRSERVALGILDHVSSGFPAATLDDHWLQERTTTLFSFSFAFRLRASPSTLLAEADGRLRIADILSQPPSWHLGKARPPRDYRGRPTSAPMFGPRRGLARRPRGKRNRKPLPALPHHHHHEHAFGEHIHAYLAGAFDSS